MYGQEATAKPDGSAITATLGRQPLTLGLRERAKSLRAVIELDGSYSYRDKSNEERDELKIRRLREAGTFGYRL